jgi:hypothetical protein
VVVGLLGDAVTLEESSAVRRIAASRSNLSHHSAVSVMMRR